MTQAITNTTPNNSLYTMLQQAENTDVACKNENDKFTSCIEESSNKISQTIGDFRNSKASYTDARANFKSVLKQETKQANDESSLNLTLADDIKNHIEQLQDINSENTCTTTETSNTDDTNITGALTSTDILTSIQEVTSMLTEDLPISTITEKNTDTDILNQESLLENVEIQDTNLISSDNDTDIINSVISRLTDTSKITTNDKTNSAQESTTDEPEISDEMLRELNVESVDAETTGDASQGSFDMQQQTTEEHVIKAMICDSDTAFDNKVTETQKTVNTENSTSKSNQTNNVIEQISKQLNGINSNSKVNIVLNPESLGKVSIQVAKSAEGMSAQFTVSTNEAKEILLKNLDGLKETLLSHGINSDNISVKMNETQKSEYKENWTEQNNSNNKNQEQQRNQKEEKNKNIFEKMLSFINQNEMESI